MVLRAVTIGVVGCALAAPDAGAGQAGPRSVRVIAADLYLAPKIDDPSEQAVTLVLRTDRALVHGDENATLVIPGSAVGGRTRCPKRQAAPRFSGCLGGCGRVPTRRGLAGARRRSVRAL